MPAALTANDRRWRAEEDARVLAEANLIEDDQLRLTAAKRAAIRMGKEQAERAKSLKDVAGKTSSKTSSGSTKPKRKTTPKTTKVKTSKHNVFTHIR